MASRAETDFHILRVAFIWLFSAAIVVLGAKELYLRHAHIAALEKDPARLISALRGDMDIKKICTSPETLLEEKTGRDQVQAQRQQTLETQLRKLVP